MSAAWGWALHRSESPPCCLHRLLVPARVVGAQGALGIILLVHLAGVERAVHSLALEAPVVLLFLHAAANILLRPRAINDDAIRGLLAGVPEVLRAHLVGVGQGLAAPGAGVLLRGLARSEHHEGRHEEALRLHCLKRCLGSRRAWEPAAPGEGRPE